MAKNTCDGDIYIRNLSSFIKSHERQLANALVAYKKLNSKDQSKLTSKALNNNNNSYTISATNSTNSSTIPTSSVKITSDNTEIKLLKDDGGSKTIEENGNLKSSQDHPILKVSTSTIDDEETLTKEISKPVRLSLSLHHLYFILGKFQELGINVGPMNLRPDNIDSDNNNNYVSFLSEFQRNKKLDSDTQSIHSMSSVKSVMSSVSALWNTFNSGSKADNAILELKYLYSAFSKLPCLRLANEPNAKLIEGHEEYPFETATPIIIFKNLLVLEISDLDPKEIYGWNILSSKLRYLVVKKANISDPIEILINLVEADSIVRGEDDDFIETNINEDFSNSNPSSSIMKQNDSNPSSHYHYDDYFDEEKLTKTTSHNSDLNPSSDSIDRFLFRSSTLSSSIPLTHSSINLVTSLSTSNINSLSNGTSKNHHSPTLYQPSSFSPSQHIHTSYTPHTLTPLPSHNYYYYYTHHTNNNANNNQNSSSTENAVNFSTSPTTPTSLSNYHPNRLYAEDILASSTNQPNSLTSRRSYFYKPPKKSRRSRGSSSMIISNSASGSTLLVPSQSSTNLDAIVDSKLDNSFKKTDESLKKSINRLSGANASRKSIDSHNSLDLTNSNSNGSTNNNNGQSYWKLLKHLSLTDNKIEKISLNSFDSLSNLTLLDLSYNKLTKLPSEPLSKLVSLKTLNLSFNKLLSLGQFPKSLINLTILNLRGNKISDLDSIENLSQLQKIDLRQNKLTKITNLKPLLLLNKDNVLLTSVQLLGNPIAKSRGYRVELFNLFNGVDYTNNVRIDGSRPGIFESRMLLDEKTSKMRFNNFIDESIISKMTASVSNMNLSNILNHSSVTNSMTTKNITATSTSSNINSHKREGCLNPPIEFKNPDTTDKLIKPVLDHMTTSITLLPSDNVNNLSANRSSVSSIKNLELLIDQQRQHKQPSTNDSSSINSFKPPSIPPTIEASRISPSSSLLSIRNPVTVSFVNSNSNTTTASIHSNSNSSMNHHNSIEVNNAVPPATVSECSTPLPCSVPHSQRTSNDYSSTTSSIITTNTATANVDNNPIARLSLASPALPVITQATTTTMSITSASNPVMDLRQSGLSTPTELSPAALSRSEYLVKTSNATNNSTAISSLKNNDDEDDDKENKSSDSKLSNEDFGSGLKISVG